jgi:Flp pilus assembly protein TadG
MSILFVTGGMFAFIASTMLAIDLGMVMTARTQAQRAADAGALAGATALVYNSFTDHTPEGPAVTAAINTAKTNQVAGEEPSVTPDDVTFPVDPATGENNMVEVKVWRSSVRENPMALFMAQVFGMNTANITATARATAAPAGAANCVLPVTIPDKWIEIQTGPWTPDDDFNIYETAGNKQNNGAPLPNPDVYIAPGNPGATGYNPILDKGLRLVLKENNDNKVAPSMYNPWDIPGSVGGNDYEENISQCNPHLVEKGDKMTPENGNMQGPTAHGANELIDLDPDARWVDECKCVKYSQFRQSPRIRVMPLYDPVVYANDQKTGKAKPDLVVVNYLGVFVEDVVGGEIIGRVTPIIGKLQSGTPAAGSFAKAIMLVK